MTVLGKVSNEDKISSMNKLAMLMTKEGKFKMNRYDDDSTATMKNLHCALEMLSAITSDNDMSDFATDVFEKAFGLIPSGLGSNEQETDVLLMVVLSKLTNKKLRLVGNRLVFISEILISLKYSNDIETLAKVYEAFRIISTYKASPVYMSIEKTSFKYLDTSNHKLHFKVQDIFGVAIETDYVEVVSIKNVGKDTMLFQGSKLENNILDMSSASTLIPGRYIVQLSAQLNGRPKPNTYQSYFVVNDQVTINSVSIGVSDSNEPYNMNIIKTPNSILDIDAVAASNDKLFVKFEIVSLLQPEMTKKPHQALIRLTNEQTGHAAYFTAKKIASVGDALQYSSTINLIAEVNKFTHISGDYVLSLLIGDSAYDTPHEWIVGTIQLTFPTKTHVHKSLYKESLLHTSDNTLTPLPEIFHVMRSPAKRASNFMATIFTVLTWIPLVIYVIFVLSLQLNLSYLASIPNLLLLGCFSLILLLYVSYWLALDGVSFYDTIRYLCFLCPITIIVANYTLNLLAEKRLLKEIKDKSK